MPGPEDQIKSSVGWVLASSEDTTFSGNAFLFRQDANDQYWFTCHHVIMALPELFISIDLNGERVARPASYVKEKSWPERDIAILKTSEEDWAGLKPLHLGDPFLTRKDTPDNYRLFLFGYARDRNSGRISQRLIRSLFSRHDHDDYYLKSKEEAGVDNPLQELAEEWNIQVEGPLDIAAYELHEGHHLLPGLSGAPVCYMTTDDEVACLGMFTQIWYGPARDAQRGVAIKYKDLAAAAGSLVPLYPYADCLIVTIAATRNEIVDARLRHTREKADDWWPHLAQEHFYDSHRDHWKPFEEGKDIKSIVDLLDRSGIPTGCQLISDYTGEADEILRVLTNFSGILFILDPCSTNIESLSRIIEIANQARWKASYLVACCEQRVAGRWLPAVIAATVGLRLREVTADPLCTERMESVWRAEEFIKRLGRLVESTVRIGLATWSANPLVRARLDRMVKAGAGNAARELDSFPQRMPLL